MADGTETTMKGWSSVLILLLTASMAAAQSLGEVAERERERREKEKEKKGGTRAKVIDDQELTAGGGKDSKGTFNPMAGSTPGASGGASPSPSAAAPKKSGDAPSEVDARRAEARKRLEAGYAEIARIAQTLLDTYGQYAARRCWELPDAPTDTCRSLGKTVEELLVVVTTGMRVAEEVTRQGWLPPGELRAIRQRYNMDDVLWDQLVSIVEKRSR